MVEALNGLIFDIKFECKKNNRLCLSQKNTTTRSWAKNTRSTYSSSQRLPSSRQKLRICHRRKSTDQFKLAESKQSSNSGPSIYNGSTSVKLRTWRSLRTWMFCICRMYWLLYFRIRSRRSRIWTAWRIWSIWPWMITLSRRWRIWFPWGN